MESEIKKNILIVSSESYLDYTKALLASFFIHEKGLNIYLYLINTPKDVTEELKYKTSGYPINIRNIDRPELSDELDKRAGGLIYSELMAFSANVRVSIIKELLETEDIDSLLYIDADSIITKSIEGLFERYKKYNVSFHARPKDGLIKVLSGIMFYVNNQEARDFVNLYNDKVNDNGILTWFADQMSLSYLYHNYPESYGNISKTYIDWKYSHKSCLWVGKGRSKKKGPFVIAQESYRNAFDMLFISPEKNKLLTSKIIVYHESTAVAKRKRTASSIDVLNAAKSGIERHGQEVAIASESEYRPSKIAVIYGHPNITTKAGRSKKFICDSQQLYNGKTLIFDKGFHKNNSYHSAGWYNPNGVDNFNIRKPAGDRRIQLNVRLEPWCKSGKYILLCGDIPWDYNMTDLHENIEDQNVAINNYLSWLKATIRILKKNTRMEIVFRPAPGFSDKELFKDTIPHNMRWSYHSLTKDLENAYAVVTYGSEIAVDSLVAGVPVFMISNKSIAYSASVHNIRSINYPAYPNLKKWTAGMAYSQWTLKEISRGRAWRHLAEVL